MNSTHARRAPSSFPMTPAMAAFLVRQVRWHLEMGCSSANLVLAKEFPISRQPSVFIPTPSKGRLRANLDTTIPMESVTANPVPAGHSQSLPTSAGADLVVEGECPTKNAPGVSRVPKRQRHARRNPPLLLAKPKGVAVAVARSAARTSLVSGLKATSVDACLYQRLFPRSAPSTIAF